MPSDITGAEIIQEDADTHQRRFEFIKGPVFANVVLADEINRTPPKTQAALLQAMQEREVTVSGHTYELESPFFILATQNPIEQEGTYPLPEAALDRFMFMVYMNYPSATEEHEIIKRTTTGAPVKLRPVLKREDLIQFQGLVRSAPVSDSVIEYAVRVTPSFEDIRYVAPLVLRHRVVTNFDAEADGVSVETVVSDLVQHVTTPA